MPPSTKSPAVSMPLNNISKSYEQLRSIFQQENVKKLLRDVKKDSRIQPRNTIELIEAAKDNV